MHRGPCRLRERVLLQHSQHLDPRAKRSSGSATPDHTDTREIGRLSSTMNNVQFLSKEVVITRLNCLLLLSCRLCLSNSSCRYQICLLLLSSRLCLSNSSCRYQMRSRQRLAFVQFASCSSQGSSSSKTFRVLLHTGSRSSLHNTQILHSSHQCCWIWQIRLEPSVRSCYLISVRTRLSRFCSQTSQRFRALQCSSISTE